jgi:hypothetical protein
MKKTLKYSFSLLAMLAVLMNLDAQDRVRGPRISYDLASLALLYFDPGRMLYTVSVDYELKQDLYPVIDLGYQHLKIQEDHYHYKADGWFARIGADVNLLNYDKKADVYEMLYVGGRYGLSLFSQQAERITVKDSYWGDFSGGKIGEHSLNTHWMSLGGGMRAEVFRNFFLGWSAFMNIRFYQSGKKAMVPYNIPGFGKGENRVTVSFNYTLSYRIPMKRYTPKIKAGKK